jgi:hypothetical protein
MNGYCNFITVAHCPLSHDAADGELGEANLGLVSAQPKSTRRTLAGLLPQVAPDLARRPGCGWPLRFVSRCIAARCCGWPSACPILRPVRRRAWSASMTSRCAAATSTPRSWSTLRPGEPSTCCPAGAYAEGARDGPPARSRSLTAGTCGTAQPGRAHPQGRRPAPGLPQADLRGRRGPATPVRAHAHGRRYRRHPY